MILQKKPIAKANDWDDDDLAFEHLRKKLNERHDLRNRHVEIAKILPYSTKVEVGDKIENRCR